MRTRRSQSSSNPVSTGHHSVLLHEVVEGLSLRRTDTVVDATLGGAGHAFAIAQQLGKEGVLVGFDADGAAIARAEKRLLGVAPSVRLEHRNFRELGSALDELGIRTADAFLFDLGWSSFQLADSRGFSFQSDEPLLMTYAEEPTEDMLTAREVVNEWQESSLADVIYGWGGERYARRIAKAIVTARKTAPIATARQLADIIVAAVPSAYAHARTHPATKTFQALRIAVNDELGALGDALNAALAHAAPHARIAVISFHSLEDRTVKQRFRAWAKSELGEELTKKPIVPTTEERHANPRSRSAKLRVFKTQ